jgi:hypothetical protein
MQRYRPNDPLGLVDSPRIATDPRRRKALLDDALRRFTYLEQSYRLEKAMRLDKQNFNASLGHLKAALNLTTTAGLTTSRLDHRLETMIAIVARKLAGMPADARLQLCHKRFVDQASLIVAKRTKAMRGARGQVKLRPYVAGIMAVVQEGTKTRVMAPRDKDYDYDPHLAGANGRTVRAIVDWLEPGVSDKVLSRWMRSIRKEFAGKHMRFLDLFPGYGMQFDCDSGEPVATAGYKILSFTPNARILCPQL